MSVPRAALLIATMAAPFRRLDSTAMTTSTVMPRVSLKSMPMLQAVCQNEVCNSYRYRHKVTWMTHGMSCRSQGFSMTRHIALTQSTQLILALVAAGSIAHCGSGHPDSLSICLSSVRSSNLSNNHKSCECCLCSFCCADAALKACFVQVHIGHIFDATGLTVQFTYTMCNHSLKQCIYTMH